MRFMASDALARLPAVSKRVSASVGPIVICWSERRERKFVWFEDWRSARDPFECKAQELAPGLDVEALAGRYGELEPRGGAIRAGGRLKVSAFHAHRVEPGHNPDLFVRLSVGVKDLAILGPAHAVEQLIDRAGRSHVERFTLAGGMFDETASGPPSRMRPTPNARLALTRLLNERQPTAVALAALSIGELLFVISQARTERRPARAVRAADYALRREWAADVLNQKGGALRDLGRTRESIAVFEASIELCESARFNPYAYVGIAATHRRLGEYDEARLAAMRAHRHWPNNKYVLEVLDALERDERSVNPERRYAA
jgi:Tetratricopeptide repeat